MEDEQLRLRDERWILSSFSSSYYLSRPQPHRDRTAVTTEPPGKTGGPVKKGRVKRARLVPAFAKPVSTVGKEWRKKSREEGEEKRKRQGIKGPPRRSTA